MHLLKPRYCFGLNERVGMGELNGAGGKERSSDAVDDSRTAEFRADAGDEGGERFTNALNHIHYERRCCDQQLEADTENGFDESSEHPTSSLCDQRHGDQGAGLHLGKLVVLGQCQNHRYSGIQMLTASQGSDVFVKASECQDVSGTVDFVFAILQLVKTVLRHGCDKLRRTDGLGETGKSFSADESGHWAWIREGGRDEFEGGLL